MQGKIALEEHFAIPETAADSLGYFPEAGAGGGRRAQRRHPWPAAVADGSARHRDDAAVAECAGRPGDPRQGEGRRHRAQGQRLSRRGGAEAAGAVPGPCGAGHAGSGRGGARTRTLRQGARLSRRAGERLLARKRRGHHSLLRPAAIPAVLGHRRAARRAVLSAPAQSAAARCAHLRRPSVAAWTDLGVRPGNGGARAPLDGVRLVRRPSAAADHPRPSGREPALRHVARRQFERLDSEPQQMAGEKAARRVFLRQFLISPRRAISAPRR